MRQRFQQVGGALRTLVASQTGYNRAVELQMVEAENFATVRRAFAGELNNVESKTMPTRLFTYVSPDGMSGNVAFCSPGAAALIIEKHYDQLVNLWSDTSNPMSSYWLEDSVGPLLTTFWPGKEGLAAFAVTNTAAPGKRAQWYRQNVNDLKVEQGLQLLKCDTEHSFDARWRNAVQKRSLEKCVLHSPRGYPGIDYLLDFNHGISVTSSTSHGIAQLFLDKLKQMFENTEGSRFTLTFLITEDPAKFAPDGNEFNALMDMAGQGEKAVFVNVCVQAPQGMVVSQGIEGSEFKAPLMLETVICPV
ncbi:unnamed protein product [Symbiodinium sp. CCMP2456]|nr:unnamed protein product [Symbiodinium sp. CCMP2456]